MLPIILEAAIRSMVLVVAILLGLKLLRVRNPHILMAAWQMVLVTSLLMPFLVGWATFPLPSATLPIHQMLATDPAILFSPSSGRVLPDVRSSPIIHWRAICSAIYLVVAAFLMLRLLIGTVLTWKLCRSAFPVRDDWTAGRDVRASAFVNVPVTFGSTIILPVSYAGWDAMERRAVMAHEHSHVSQGDFYFLILSSINRAAFWFNPLAWWLHGRIAYLAEARSDAAAIQDIDDRVRYAEILLGFGSKTSRATLSLAMARPKTVRCRVESILAETILPKKMNWKVWSVVVACIVPLAAITVGAAAQVPSQTQETRVSAPAFDPETLRQRQAEQKQSRQEVQIDPAILDNYLGYYQFGAYRVFMITRQADHLFVELTGLESRQLYPESAQKFFYKSVAAQISFITDPQGRATGLVLHQDGLERPAPRIDQAQAQSLAESYAKRLKGAAPLPGSEAALRHQIEAFEQGQPDYDAMTEGLAAVTRPQIPRIERQFALLGPLQTISFRGVGFSGWDIYEAKFVNGILINRILLTPDGKITGLRFEWGP
jgi:beta-lactamase regulating signal transducer with metallopeptidase domain